jgi:hypothetical protein
VIFTPLRQGNPGGSNFQIRTRLGPQAMANVLVREVKAIDANLAPGEVITMREQGDRRTWSLRGAVTRLRIFRSIVLLLFGIGLYGVMSYAVFAEHAGAPLANGARRAAGGSIAHRDVQGIRPDTGWNRRRSDDRAGIDAVDGRHAVQNQPARSGIVRINFCDYGGPRSPQVSRALRWA